MSNFSLSLQAKALCSMLATVGVASGVAFHWQDQAVTSQSFESPPALPLPDATSIAAPVASTLLRTIVVRSGSNLPSKSAAIELAHRLKTAGVKRAWVQFKQDETDEFEGGNVFYPSKLAPVAKGFEDGRLMAFVNELHASGIQVAAWLPALHDPAAWESHAEWRSSFVTESGTIEQRHGWLCPKHPEAIRYEASLLAEVAALCKEQLSGIYTDFIRYDDDFSCACHRCMGELSKRTGKGPIEPQALRAEAKSSSPMWEAWTALRGDAIHDAVDVMRDALTEVAPNIWFGASVLPFSALDYELNTQSGQDLEKMCRAGLDEIVLMGYWDDWDKSPTWLAESVAHAQKIVGGEARVSCLLDADMSIRRTMKTVEAVSLPACDFAWFNYGEWNPSTVDRLHRAEAQLRTHGGTPRSQFTAVTIRIDTEPDAGHSYERVQPEMIDKLVTLFAEEQIKATFVTCGKLAEQQPQAVKRAQAAGHEIAGHAYDHEQIDSLPEKEQLIVMNRMTRSFEAINIRLTGFGAPRNSNTDSVRDRLIQNGFFYDGSAAYDPLQGYIDPQIIAHTGDAAKGILLVPFIVPNDWDARYQMKLSAQEMQQAWTTRLNVVAEAGEPCFVLDIHQWIASQPDNLEAVRQFIRTAKARSDCRVMTLNATAHHVLNELIRAEGCLMARP